jgi:hypothetical protein
MDIPSTDPATIWPSWSSLKNRRSSTLANLLASVDIALRTLTTHRCRCAARLDGGRLRQVATLGLVLSYGELSGSTGLGFVWGWLLVQLTVASQPSVQLTVASQPSVQRWIVPLVGTVALLGAVVILLNVRAMVICVVAMGVSAALHAAFIARLRLESGSHESIQFIGGEPR